MLLHHKFSRSKQASNSAQFFCNWKFHIYVSDLFCSILRLLVLIYWLLFEKMRLEDDILGSYRSARFLPIVLWRYHISRCGTVRCLSTADQP